MRVRLSSGNGRMARIRATSATTASQLRLASGAGATSAGAEAAAGVVSAATGSAAAGAEAEASLSFFEQAVTKPNDSNNRQYPCFMVFGVYGTVGNDQFL